MKKIIGWIMLSVFILAVLWGLAKEEGSDILISLGILIGSVGIAVFLGIAVYLILEG